MSQEPEASRPSGSRHSAVTQYECPSRRVVSAPAYRVDPHLVSLLSPQSIESEQYRALQCLLEPRHRAGELTVLLVTSPGARDGKTTTATLLWSAWRAAETW